MKGNNFLKTINFETMKELEKFNHKEVLDYLDEKEIQIYFAYYRRELSAEEFTAMTQAINDMKNFVSI